MIEEKIISIALYLSPIIHVSAKTIVIVGLYSFAAVGLASGAYAFWKLNKLTNPIVERLGMKLRKRERLVLSEKVFGAVLGIIGIGMFGYCVVEIANILR